MQKNKKIRFITGMKVSNAKMGNIHYISYIAAMTYQCKTVVPFHTFSEETQCKIFSPSQQKCEDR
jgi:hypothetical protein